MAGIEAGLGKASDMRVELNVEYLDTKAHPLQAIAPQLKELFAKKYATVRPDVIITSDDNALDFMLANTDELFPGIPVVFCGVNVFSDTRLQGRKNFTGVLEDYDIRGTIEILRKLHPGMNTLAVVSDSTETGNINLERFRAESRGRHDQVDVRELSNMTSDELAEALGHLPVGAVILNLSFFRDRDGRSYSPKEGSAFISEKSKLPIYSCWDFFLEGDVVGGRVVSGYSQGYEAAAMALDILRGIPVDSIPVQRDSPNQYMFDYGPLVRAGLSKADLPEGSIILREPDTLYSRFKRELLYFFIFSTFMTAMMVFMGVNIAHRRRIQRQLASTLAEYQSVFDNSQVGILHLKGGRILYRVNKRAADIFGYDSPEELSGLESRVLHASDKSWREFGKSHFVTLTNSGSLHVEWPMIRKNGEHFTALLSGKTVDTKLPPDLSLGVIWVVDDISDRKRAEDALKKSEEKMRLFFERQLMGSAITTPQKGWDRVNDRLCQMLGYSREELMQKTWAELTHPDDLDPDFERFNKLMAGEIDEYSLEKRFIRKDSTLLFTNLAVACVRDNSREVEYIVALLEDITDRKIAEDALRSSEEQFRSIVESSPMGMHFYRLDEDDRLLLVAANAASDRILSIKHAALTGLPIEEAFPGLKGTHIPELYRKVALGQVGMQSFETSYSDGMLTGVYEVYVFKTGDRSVATLYADISDRKKVQELMIQTEKMMSVGGLAAGMAHEINNPLSGILQNVQVMKRRLTTDLPANLRAAEEAGCTFDAIRCFMEAREILTSLESIREAGARAARIVASMLAFSRKSESNFAPTDINALLDRSWELCSTDYDLKKKYDFRNIRAIREYDICLPLVPCMETQIQQVFMNILANAAQAMAEVPSPVITLRTTAEGEWALIEIEDNGPGMPGKVSKHVFEPFYTTKPAGEGTGLGLSVSYFIIVNHHRGTVDVDSALGEGTKFIIRLPFIMNQTNNLG